MFGEFQFDKNPKANIDCGIGFYNSQFNMHPKGCVVTIIPRDSIPSVDLGPSEIFDVPILSELISVKQTNSESKLDIGGLNNLNEILCQRQKQLDKCDYCSIWFNFNSNFIRSNSESLEFPDSENNQNTN